MEEDYLHLRTSDLGFPRLISTLYSNSIATSVFLHYDNYVSSHTDEFLSISIYLMFIA